MSPPEFKETHLSHECSCGCRVLTTSWSSLRLSSGQKHSLYFVLFEEFTQIPGLYFGMKIVVFLFFKARVLRDSVCRGSDVNTPHGFVFFGHI